MRLLFFLSAHSIGRSHPALLLSNTNVPSFARKTHTYRERPSHQGPTIKYSDHKVPQKAASTARCSARAHDRRRKSIRPRIASVHLLEHLGRVERDERDRVTSRVPRSRAPYVPWRKGETILGASVATFFRDREHRRGARRILIPPRRTQHVNARLSFCRCATRPKAEVARASYQLPKIVDGLDSERPQDQARRVRL